MLRVLAGLLAHEPSVSTGFIYTTSVSIVIDTQVTLLSQYKASRIVIITLVEAKNILRKNIETTLTIFRMTKIIQWKDLEFVCYYMILLRPSQS